jgi:hypothetical protein
MARSAAARASARSVPAAMLASHHRWLASVMNWRLTPYVSRVCAGRGSVTALGLRVGRACLRSVGAPADSGLRAPSGSCPGPCPAHCVRPGARCPVPGARCLVPAHHCLYPRTPSPAPCTRQRIRAARPPAARRRRRPPGKLSPVPGPPASGLASPPSGPPGPQAAQRLPVYGLRYWLRWHGGYREDL